jgi:hypothetical protein
VLCTNCTSISDGIMTVPVVNQGPNL